MKFPITVQCACGTLVRVEATGTGKFPTAKCPNPECEITMYSAADSMTVAVRVWHRAKAELDERDYTLCIILSAMAVECQLAQLFFKWRNIDHTRADPDAPMIATQAQAEAWEGEYRKWARITEKLDQVCRFLTGMDFDSFVGAKPEVSELLVKRHSDAAGVSPKRFFEENLFRKRNGIIHFARVDSTETDAAYCLQLALTLYNVLEAADRHKYDQAFPPQQAAQPTST